MRAQHQTNVSIYLPVVCKDEQQLTPASSLYSVSSHRVNTTHCVWCQIKGTDSDRGKPQSLPQ